MAAFVLSGPGETQKFQSVSFCCFPYPWERALKKKENAVGLNLPSYSIAKLYPF